MTRWLRKAVRAARRNPAAGWMTAGAMAALLVVPLLWMQSGAAPSLDSNLRGKTEQGPNHLHTEGARIVDAGGEPVRLTGVNWFGMETGTYAPHGLWARNWEAVLDEIAALGFNTIRLPYSNEALHAAAVPEGIDYELNPDLRGLSPLEVLDRIIAGAGERGLKVILDRHRPTAEAQAELWYTEEVPEAEWIADWEMLAARYRGNDTVIGADLHNEPHGAATWGTGDPATDWRLAAERAGNAILAVNPHWLIIVEGVERHGDDWYWWGGNLQGAREHPVRLSVPNRLVYSAHDYGPGVNQQGWFSDSEFPANLDEVWDRHWGYLVEEGIAPVLLGEFGGRSVDPEDTEGVWQRRLMDFLTEKGISYTYWSYNPNSADTGGILMDDWATVHRGKMELLARHQAPLLENHRPDVVQRDARPERANDPVKVAAKPTPARAEPAAPRHTDHEPVEDGSPEALRVEYRTGRADAKTNNPAPELRVVNPGPRPVPLDGVELRYWFTADGGPPEHEVDVDWASVDGVDLEVVEDRRGDQTHALRVAFGGEAGRLEPGEAVELKLRLHKADWSDYVQTDDYSFGEAAEYREWPQVGLYADGSLVWGEEPG